MNERNDAEPPEPLPAHTIRSLAAREVQSC